MVTIFKALIKELLYVYLYINTYFKYLYAYIKLQIFLHIEYILYVPIWCSQFSGFSKSTSEDPVNQRSKYLEKMISELQMHRHFSCHYSLNSTMEWRRGPPVCFR